MLVSMEGGLQFDTPYPLKFNTSFGYNVVTGDGIKGLGTLFPFFYQFSLTWNIFKKFDANAKWNKI